MGYEGVGYGGLELRGLGIWGSGTWGVGCGGAELGGVHGAAAGTSFGAGGAPAGQWCTGSGSPVDGARAVCNSESEVSAQRWLCGVT